MEQLQFAAPKTFQAKPSGLKKKIALVVFIAGAIAFTLAVAKVIEPGNGMFFFVGGILAMAFAFRFWNMQVRAGATALTFDTRAITLANRSALQIIEWGSWRRFAIKPRGADIIGKSRHAAAIRLTIFIWTG
jgi:hypothetical protein